MLWFICCLSLPFFIATNWFNALSIYGWITHEMCRIMKDKHGSWNTCHGKLEDRSILCMTCTQSIVLLTQTENTDIVTIVFLKPLGMGQMEDHLPNKHKQNTTSVTCWSLVHVAFVRTKGAYHELIAVTTCISCTQVCTIQVNHSYVAWPSFLYTVLLREQSISAGVKRGSWKSGGSKTYDLAPCPKLNIAWPWDSKNFDNLHPSRCDLVHYGDFTTNPMP